jgi:hypothetical protein
VSIEGSAAEEKPNTVLSFLEYGNLAFKKPYCLYTSQPKASIKTINSNFLIGFTPSLTETFILQEISLASYFLVV